MNLSIDFPAIHHRPDADIARSADAPQKIFQASSGIDFERRFLTILFANVVNYCCMIEADDLRTVLHLERLKTEVIQPTAEDHGADMLRNFGGDGLVMSFAEPLMAVRCAIDLQARVEANGRYWSTDERFHFRIGIAMGSVLLVNVDLHGSAMNVAARLQALAKPREIWVAEPVARQACRQADIAFEPLGQQHLRNIEESAEVYRFACPAC